MTPNPSICQHTTYQGLEHEGIHVIIYKEFYTVFNHNFFKENGVWDNSWDVITETIMFY